MRVMIAGGGIGGLVAALSLHDAGIDATVFEAVGEIRPLGVGINLLPHAVRELSELGLAERLDAVAIRTRELVYVNKFGQTIWREDRGLDAGYRWPQFSIHRGTLQMLLLEAVRARLGADAVRTDRRLVAFEDDGRRVRATFEDRTGTRHQDEADVLIGADGIHSAVRRAFYPEEGAPIWNGAVLWRATTEAEPFLGGRSMVMAGHQVQKFVCYPISGELAQRGRSLVNWIAELRFDPSRGWRREDWNRPGRVEDFLPRFEAWNFGWLDAPSLIRGAAAVYEYPMVDRDPVERWSFGRVTLLGDAAHPMYPIGSNGASQAILDARVLAHRLATSGDPVEALAAYDAERRPGTARIVLANRAKRPGARHAGRRGACAGGIRAARGRDLARGARDGGGRLQDDRRLRQGPPERAPLAVGRQGRPTVRKLEHLYPRSLSARGVWPSLQRFLSKKRGGARRGRPRPRGRAETGRQAGPA
jgi:2-polyprenyl-6-methoxyphenol hydroxylase-like FAD-dependent oxidoreductase